MEVTTFTCSICGETSRDICIYCTKDACGNHLCDRCHRCSDCCACEMPVFTESAGVQKVNGHLTALTSSDVAESEFSSEPLD